MISSCKFACFKNVCYGCDKRLGLFQVRQFYEIGEMTLIEISVVENMRGGGNIEKLGHYLFDFAVLLNRNLSKSS